VSEKRVDSHAYLKTLKSLFTNRNFALLLVSYGINVGVFYVVSTLLNQIVLLHFKVSSAKNTTNDMKGCNETKERNTERTKIN